MKIRLKVPKIKFKSILEEVEDNYIAIPEECIKYQPLIEEIKEAYKLFIEGYWHLEEEKIDKIFKEIPREREEYQTFRKCLWFYARNVRKRDKKAFQGWLCEHIAEPPEEEEKKEPWEEELEWGPSW